MTAKLDGETQFPEEKPADVFIQSSVGRIDNSVQFWAINWDELHRDLPIVNYMGARLKDRLKGFKTMGILTLVPGKIRNSTNEQIDENKRYWWYSFNNEFLKEMIKCDFEELLVGRFSPSKALRDPKILFSDPGKILAVYTNFLSEEESKKLGNISDELGKSIPSIKLLLENLKVIRAEYAELEKKTIKAFSNISQQEWAWLAMVNSKS
jgi:hypothetical protein